MQERDDGRAGGDPRGGERAEGTGGPVDERAEDDAGAVLAELPWQEEIEELHHFFQAWFRGELPDTEAAFGRVVRALSPDLIFVSPSGDRSTRPELLRGIRAGHARRPGLSIRIETPTLHHVVDGHLVATYEEWQEDEGETTARLSTVVFGVEPGAPNGLVWLHVHETWMEAG